MPTKEQVLRALRSAGDDPEAVARRLGIPAGQVALIATGRPAAERLVNPAHHDPVRKDHVVAWVRERAARDLTTPR